MKNTKTIPQAAAALGCTPTNLYQLSRLRCPKCKGSSDDCPRCRGHGTKLPLVIRPWIDKQYRPHQEKRVPDWIIPIIEREKAIRRYPQWLPAGVTVEVAGTVGVLAVYGANDELLGTVIHCGGRSWKWERTIHEGPVGRGRDNAIRGLLDDKN